MKPSVGCYLLSGYMWNKSFYKHDRGLYPTDETWRGVSVSLMPCCCARRQVPVVDVSDSVPTGDVQISTVDVPGKIPIVVYSRSAYCMHPTTAPAFSNFLARRNATVNCSFSVIVLQASQAVKDSNIFWSCESR